MRTNCGDEFDKYCGTDAAKAEYVYAGECEYLPNGNDDVRVELRAYDVPDNWQDMDADDQTDYLCGDYTLIKSDQGKRYKAGW